MERSESTPSKWVARTGTPITGKGVSEATIPNFKERKANPFQNIQKLYGAIWWEGQAEVMFKTYLVSEQHHQHLQL